MRRNYRRLALFLLIVLVLFFALESYIVGNYLEDYLSTREVEHMEHEIAMLDAVVLDSLIRHDYVLIEQLVSHWGLGHESVVSVTVEMPNGFALGSHVREKEPKGETYKKKEVVSFEGEDLAVIYVVSDYREVEMLVNTTRLRFLIASIVFLMLLGLVVWLAQKKMLLVPLEKEIAVSKEVREHLEAIVQERTAELKRELHERQRTEKQLLDREKDLTLIMDSMAEAIYGLNVNGECTFVNPSCLRMLGYENDDDLLGKNMHEIIHHTNADGSPNPGEDCKVCKAYKHVEGVHVDDEILWRKDGTSFPVEYWSYPIISDDGVIGAVVTFLDITLRKKAEEEKQTLISTMNALLEHMPVGVFLLDADDTLIMTNPVSQEYLYQIAEVGPDRKMKSLAGRPLSTLLVSPPQILWHDVEVQQRIFEVGGRILADGARVFVVREVTKERELDKQLRMQDRLAAVGQLAAGIAHDFNNILTVINGYAEMTLTDPSLDEENRKALNAIFQSGERAASLIHQILDFSRKTVGEREPLELNGFVNEFGDFIKRTVPANITLDITPADTELVVRVDPAKLQQVIANLVVNARDAMPQGGSLGITLARRDYFEHDAKGNAASELAGGQWALLSVSDTGDGIQEEVLPHIFEPFYTTKEMGKGTGLGLPQVYGLVKQHDGVVNVSSKVGQGTTFEVYLPLVSEMAEGQLASKERVGNIPAGKGQTVLVAEDEPAVRQLVANVLRSAGYQVLAAENGKKAIELYEASLQKIALLVTDIIMPEMGGLALSKELKERDHSIKIIAITGYADGVNDDALNEAGIEQLISKPFKIRALAEAVSNILAQ